MSLDAIRPNASVPDNIMPGNPNAALDSLNLLLNKRQAEILETFPYPLDTQFTETFNIDPSTVDFSDPEIQRQFLEDPAVREILNSANVTIQTIIGEGGVTGNFSINPRIGRINGRNVVSSIIKLESENGDISFYPTNPINRTTNAVAIPHGVLGELFVQHSNAEVDRVVMGVQIGVRIYVLETNYQGGQPTWTEPQDMSNFEITRGIDFPTWIATGVTQSTSTTNLRAGPSVNDGVREALPAGTPVFVLEYVENRLGEDWSKVRLMSGKEGFIKQDLITRIETIARDSAAQILPTVTFELVNNSLQATQAAPEIEPIGIPIVSADRSIFNVNVSNDMLAIANNVIASYGDLDVIQAQADLEGIVITGFNTDFLALEGVDNMGRRRYFINGTGTYGLPNGENRAIDNARDGWALFGGTIEASNGFKLNIFSGDEIIWSDTNVGFMLNRNHRIFSDQVFVDEFLAQVQREFPEKTNGQWNVMVINDDINRQLMGATSQSTDRAEELMRIKGDFTYFGPGAWSNSGKEYHFNDTYFILVSMSSSQRSLDDDGWHASDILAGALCVMGSRGQHYYEFNGQEVIMDVYQPLFDKYAIGGNFIMAVPIEFMSQSNLSRKLITRSPNKSQQTPEDSEIIRNSIQDVYMRNLGGTFVDNDLSDKVKKDYSSKAAVQHLKPFKRSYKES